ncbi:OmpA family protein [Lutimonas vermicola]|uniref:OmpA family protein n=1 Tax=Lutimonas vermicola TaxID=414288 RepID=A0ABU9L358_9FLAO
MKRGFILIFFLAWVLQATGQSTGKYQIKFLEVNKKNSDYGVAILDENKLIFTSADHKVTTANKNYNPRKDLYAGDINFDGEIKNVKRVSKDINKKVNQTGVTYSTDGKTVYFSRNKYKKKLKKQNLPKNKRLLLYKADVASDGSWTNIKKLPFNKKNSSTGYPVLSPDGKKLYFVSDRLPSKGNTDIFVVDILGDGNYSQPRNLGSLVNTKGNETTPFITEDNILYFSSDGREGQGKLDVYAVEVYDNATSEPYELAAPINSINDDFAYIVNKDNNLGFFTSNRLQGDGFNDLYSFTLEEDYRPGECFITVDGKVRDKESLESISGATVDLYSIDGSLLESVSTYNDGTYQFTVSCAKEYQLVASNPNYLDDKKRIEILEENYHSALHTNLNLTKVMKKAPAVERLSPIYYEFDDANITEEAAEEMDKIAEIMSQNENLIIEASSFTDSRGTNAYNVELSKRRAKAAVEYLKSKGIDESRIKSKGYGEEKLINQCVNGVECKEESHQMNRRTEFNFANVPAAVPSKKKSGSSKTKVAVQTKKTVAPVITKPKDAKETEAVAEVSLSEVKEVPSVVKVDEGTKPAPLQKKLSLESARIETVKVAATDHQISAPVIYKNSVKSTPVVQVEKEEIETPAIALEEKVIEKQVDTKEIETPAVALEEEVIEKQVDTKEIAENKPELKEENSGKIEEKQEEVVASEEKEKTDNKEVKEAVIINYNSTIVATNPESNKVLNYIGTEKVKMMDQLSDLEKQYDEAIPLYPKLSDSLKVEKGRIADIIANARELEETGWSNIIEYKNNVLHFKKRYRDLMVTNSRRTVSGSMTREERQMAHAPKKAEQNMVAEADKPKPKVVEMEENLSVDNVEITAMKKNGNGKYQKTNSASKTDLIKVTFKLKSNEKVNSGRKEAHLVLQNPDGQVEEAKGIFTPKDADTESKYTDHAIINYNNHDVDVTMFIQRRGNNFQKGVYPVKVFLEGELMTVTKLNLENSF